MEPIGEERAKIIEEKVNFQEYPGLKGVRQSGTQGGPEKSVLSNIAAQGEDKP